MIVDSNSQFSFGALLKVLRKRRRLTQQQLATAIGTHRNAIGRWEQGDFLPASKTMVLELARVLHLNEQETRQLLEASLTALSSHWHVPFPRNPFFTGRETILEALHIQLGVERAVALTQSSALHGLGGVGKTQIALEYAYRHALDYSAVFWIGAETEEQMTSSLLRIADALQLPERDDKNQQRVITAVQHWLTTHSQWLVICDNLEERRLMLRFLPVARSGAILITTRNQVLGTLAQGLDLLPMEQQEGMLFLLRRAKVLQAEATRKEVRQFAVCMPAQYAAAAELVSALGGLPLALDQAGAYLEETHCGLPAYLGLFRSQGADLLQQRGEEVYDHPASVTTTFALAIAATAERHPAVGDLLHVCALLQPDTIPEELFRQGAAHLGPTLEAVCRDELEWNRLVAVACSYSLLSRQPEEQTLSLHRLVQVVLLDTTTKAERELWTRRVIAILDAVFPEVLSHAEYSVWQQGERLLSHALVCLERLGVADDSLACASLAYKTALYLHALGRYREAELLFLRAVRVREMVLGTEHPQVASLLYRLATINQKQGKYAEAEQLFLRALQVQEHLLGPDHPDVATSLNSLAALFWSQSKYTEAQPLLLRALHIWERQLGSEHSNVATSLNGLAILSYEQGKYAEAEPLYRRALYIWEQQLGPEHPQVTNTLNNLAILYQEQGRYAEAEPLYQRALYIWEQQLGPEYPDVMYPLTGLADLYREQGKYAEAEPLYQRAVHIWEQGLGSEHPQVAYALTGLADLYREQDNYEEAELLYQRAVHIREQAFGPEHPDVAASLTGLANLYREQSKYKEAEPLFQRALAIREQHLGRHHPKTAQTLHNLALLYQKQGKLNEAAPLAERALSIRLQSLGDTHPETVAIRTLLTDLGQKQMYIDNTAKPFPLDVSPRARVESNDLQAFLDACCELHPRAWCRSADLWEAYERWVREQQERFPLSRRAFTTQVKAHGCRADRTKSARIWRGITIASGAARQKMTEDDRR